MNSEFNYFRVHRSNDDQIPLLNSDDDCPQYLSKKKSIENPELLLFKFGEPIPRKPKMADYHSSPKSIISKKIFDVLEPLKIEGIQLLPAQIRGKNDDVYSDYWAIHVYNRIRCVDPDLSDCTIDTFNLEDVNKIVLDEKILSKIPLSKRLVFRLEEDTAFQLFHSSIVDIIMKTNPEGVQFTNINNWHEGSFF